MLSDEQVRREMYSLPCPWQFVNYAVRVLRHFDTFGRWNIDHMWHMSHGLLLGDRVFASP